MKNGRTPEQEAKSGVAKGCLIFVLFGFVALGLPSIRLVDGVLNEPRAQIREQIGRFEKVQYDLKDDPFIVTKIAQPSRNRAVYDVEIDGRHFDTSYHFKVTTSYRKVLFFEPRLKILTVENEKPR